MLYIAPAVEGAYGYQFLFHITRQICIGISNRSITRSSKAGHLKTITNRSARSSGDGYFHIVGGAAYIGRHRCGSARGKNLYRGGNSSITTTGVAAATGLAGAGRTRVVSICGSGTSAGATRNNNIQCSN